MNELYDYLSCMMAHLDDMGKRTIFMMGMEYGRTQSQEQKNNNTCGDAFSSKENANMLLDISGVSINAKPRSDGRYQGYVLREGRKKYFYGKSPEEVKSQIQNYLNNSPAPERKKRTERNAPCLREYAEKWVETYKRPNMKPTSYQCLFYALKKPLAALGDKPLNKITTDDLQAFFNGLPQSRARDLCKTYLTQMFEKAVATKVIKDNPFTAVEIKKTEKTRKTGLTPEQQNLFLQAIKDLSLSLLFRFLLSTGLRIGEALALTPKDIDRQNKTVSISKNIVFLEGGNQVVQSPKTRAAFRIVPIPDVICQEVCQIQTERIFPVTYNHVRKTINRISQKLGFSVTVHSLRHTYSDRLEEAGVPPKVKQYLLGHSDLDTTQNIYTDTQEHYVETYSEQIRGLFDTK